jgi:4-amino-4-deoxy-L-arabinose transferase-like glycosyltransferase
VVLPWLVAIEVSTHGRFLADSVGGDMGRKLVGGDNAHGAPPGTYALLLALTLFPAGFVVLRALPAAWAARGEPATRFLLAWVGPAWLVFEAVPTKLPHYVLPLYPALCLLGARWAVGNGRVWRWLSVLSASLFGVAGGVFAAGAVALPVVVGAGVTVGVPAALAAGLVVAVGLRSRAAWAGLLAVPLLWWAILAVELPRLPQLWVSAGVAAWLDRRPVSGFAAVGYAEPSLMFAAGTGTRWLDAGAAARFLAADAGRVVAVAERQVGPFLVAAGRMSPRAFATVRGFDYSVGRSVALTLFRAGSAKP